MHHYSIIINRDKHAMIWLQHPGGLDVIMEYAGSDATVAFMDKGHSKDAWMILSDYYIGELVKVSANILYTRPVKVHSLPLKRVICKIIFTHIKLFQNWFIRKY